MNKSPDYILGATDSRINQTLSESRSEGIAYTRHFSQDEDFFLRLEEPFTIPSFKIHHNIGQHTPEKEYTDSLLPFVEELHRLLPGVFTGLRWFFDFREHLKPTFFHLLKRNNYFYLYTLVVDLLYKPRGCEIIKQGSNSLTPAYKTRNLYLDSYIVRLEGQLEDVGTEKHGFIPKLFNDTFIGESGRGYFVQGTWIDPLLNRFLSKLFVPQGKRVYPYFPFRCIHDSVATTVLGFQPEARRRATIIHDQVMDFLSPFAQSIQNVLKKNEFSVELPLFQKIQKQVPSGIKSYFLDYDLEVNLNEDNQREYDYHAGSKGL
jgi:hypothetical protein